MADESVSVVIATYNRAKTVSRAIESVLAQTYSPSEVIVVDDGSQDTTPQVLETFHHRIRSIRQHNQGRAVARNVGAAMCTGTWIAFQDDDDEWYPNKLELQVLVARALPQIRVIFSDVDGVGERGKFPRMKSKMFEDLEKRFLLGKESFFPHCASLKDLGIHVSNVDSSAKVYYGPIFEHLWVKPFILNPTVLIKRNCLIPYPPDTSDGTDSKFFIELSKAYWFAFIDLPTMAYSLYADEGKGSGPKFMKSRYQRIVNAHRSIYGWGSNLNPVHRVFYRRQMAYFLHRIAIEDLFRLDRKGARTYAMKSIEAAWKQMAAYLILALSMMPKPVIKLVQKYGHLHD